MKKNYYLIIPSSDIYVKTKKNDIVTIDHGEAISIFDKYGIPKKYQKIIIKVSLKNNIAKELLTHSAYFLKDSIIKSISENNGLLALDSIDNIIETKVAIYHIDKVKLFYQNIINNKLSVNYEKAVKELYRYHYLKKKENKLKKIKRNEYIH